MKKYLISGLVDTYRIKVNLFASSPNSAVSIFKQKYPSADDIYVIQDLLINCRYKNDEIFDRQRPPLNHILLIFL